MASILRRWQYLAAAVAAVVALPALAGEAQSQVVAIRAGRLIDGTGAPPIANAVILTEADRVISVGSQVRVPAGARSAVMGGVRSIEHGALLDAATIRLMAERGTYFCPTLSNFTPATALAGYPDALVQRVMARHQQAFKEALRAGVKIAFGTDAGRVRHGTNAGEFTLMVGFGMEPMRAIQTATSVAAELLRLEDEIGTLKPGLQADLIAVRGDPLADIRLLQDVRFVMKAGRVVKAPSVVAPPAAGK